PDDTDDPARARSIVEKVAAIVTAAAREAARTEIGRDRIAEGAQTRAETLLEEYFDLNERERMLIADTDKIIIPSARPTRTRLEVPTLQPAQDKQRSAYTKLLCDTLNSWASKEHHVQGVTSADGYLGV